MVVVITATNLHAPEGTQTWCPFCDKARGNIKTVLIPSATSAKNGEKILYCTVKREEWVGNASHLYKADARIKARGVPTVLLIKRGDGDKWDVVHRVEKD